MMLVILSDLKILLFVLFFSSFFFFIRVPCMGSVKSGKFPYYYLHLDCVPSEFSKYRSMKDTSILSNNGNFE